MDRGSSTPRILLFVLVACALGGMLPASGAGHAVADSSTASPVAGTPWVTPDPSVLPPSPEPTATEPVTVAPEPPAPTPTTLAPATEPPTPIPLVGTTPAGRRARPNGASTPTPVIVQGGYPPGGAPAVAPLPSPAELRENARLRWGTHVPAAVRRWAFLIVPAARKYGLNPNLIAAVMTMESGGDPLAWNSGSDARGLMQVLHGPWDPRDNVFTGAHMLADFYVQFQDLTLALAAYNAGPNAVIAYGGVPPYRETRDYVIVVRYLFDLFDHHRLTPKRRAQYRATLTDLQRFADQRRKVRRLAQTGHVQVSPYLGCRRFQQACDQAQPTIIFRTLDPFWPIDEGPDPLQHVDPYASGS